MIRNDTIKWPCLISVICEVNTFVQVQVVYLFKLIQIRFEFTNKMPEVVLSSKKLPVEMYPTGLYYKVHS
jgi:hypothetical protein